MVTRRSFVVASTLSLVAFRAAQLPALNPRPRRADHVLVIRGGTVFDGTGTDGRSGTDEIDARGLAVAPGFIDIHSHGDGSLTADSRAESVIRQGVTTIVCGADGSSRFLGSADRSFTAWASTTNALKPAVNVAAMIGLGAVRGAVVGNDDRRATPDELQRMVAMVERALDELIALCRPLASRHMPYATHIRNEDDRLLEAIDESIAVARGADCPLQISHLKMQGTRNWPKINTALARLTTARSADIEAMFDVYPGALPHPFARRPLRTFVVGAIALAQGALRPATILRIVREPRPHVCGIMLQSREALRGLGAGGRFGRRGLRRAMALQHRRRGGFPLGGLPFDVRARARFAASMHCSRVSLT